MLRLALGVLFASVATLARAAELETTHLFGFTLGSDVNAVGEKEAESEAFGRFGKSTGTYSALSQALGVKFIPVQNFSIEPVVSVTRFDISGVPGLDDRQQLTYEARDALPATQSGTGTLWPYRWL
jgi:predicted alpha/beta hydrolase